MLLTHLTRLSSGPRLLRKVSSSLERKTAGERSRFMQKITEPSVFKSSHEGTRKKAVDLAVQKVFRYACMAV